MDVPTTNDVIARMSPFSYDELHRLVDLIPETDPRTPQYGILLEAIERYGAAMGNVETILRLPDPRVKPEVIPFTPPTGEADKFEEQVTTDKIECVAETADKFAGSVAETADNIAVKEEPAPEYDPYTVKAAITRARAEKKIDSIKSWITENCGVDGFNAIPAKSYPEVMAKLKELGVS